MEERERRKREETGMKKIGTVLLAAVIAALVWLNVSAEKGPEPDVIIPMANAGIEWSGAGYSGIYGK